MAHEAGHLLGFEHAHTVHTATPAMSLAEVAFQPETHVEIAKDVRADLIADGRLTIAGNEYDVHPKIVEALRKYPSYYYAGTVGPDAFPGLRSRPGHHPSGGHRRLAAAHARHGLGVADRPGLDSPRSACRTSPSPTAS